MLDHLRAELRYRMDVPETPARRVPVRAAAAPPLRFDRVALGMGLYSAFVVCLILAYHVVLYVAVSVLSSFLAHALASGTLQAANPMPILLLAVICLLLTRLICHICWSTLGLIRDGQDLGGELAEAVPLSRENHAEMYALVSDVAQRIAAPLPDEIRIEPRALSHVSELRSLHAPQDRHLVLVLGLAQIAVFSVRELQVLLAHELAHFLCGDTRLRVFTCRFVDTLEDSVQACKGKPWRLGDPLFWFSLVFVRLFRIVAAPLHRQQELRADCISAAAYGGPLARHTLLKDWALGLRFDEFLQPNDEQSCLSREDIIRRFDEFVAGWQDLSPAASEYLADRLKAEEPVSFWDSHPSVQRRLAAMQHYTQPEVPDHRPARELLPDFRGLVERLVSRFWKEDREAFDESRVLRRCANPCCGYSRPTCGREAHLRP